MQTIIITGASDGIGAASARQLKAKGHNVVLVGRSQQKTENLAKEIDASFHLADYSRLTDVRRLASELRQYDRIDVLANNAGGIMGKRELTENGFEKTFQVNHLAPFLLTKLLMEQLIACRAKVIQTSSAAANAFGKRFNVTDLNNERSYSPQTAYGYGKLENILFTRELDRRYRASGISTVAFHPGVVRSSFASDTTHFMKFVYHTPIKYLLTISPEKSARRLSALAEGKPGVDWNLGEVYSNGKPMSVAFKDDGTVARELWERSEQFLNTELSK
ncbi:SDR family NAD(P)-dependent oxidoreductase [Saliterribacillus persicus]|uniref:Short-subunit dehydrogenase n=1 Tax=Saliterribacillus persicus TaxID=930114 RepID=A0A368Y842_9BACI|nr:SDR family NAD(P)-dependent oxidoreductase [Saliterribacillus persicus]RCW74997.1 short-subunit dehydrogenase [Saliterribacillus persicus]